MHSDSDDPYRSIVAMARAAGFLELPSDVGVVVQDAVGVIVAASEAAQAILGLPFGEMRGRTSLDPRWAAIDEAGRFLDGAEHPAVLAARTGTAVRNHIMGVHRPGSDAAGHHVWVRVDAVPLFRGEDTEPWAVVSAIQPVRGEKLRALQLADSERLFRMLAEHSCDMVAWQLVPETTFLWVSPAASTVLGFEPHELIGTDGIDLVHPEDRSALAESWQQATEALPTFTMRMRQADGCYRWVETTAHVLPTQPDRPQQMVTVHRDISDRVSAERDRDAALRMFELAMRHATIGVAWRGLDGILKQVNPALCRILGRTAQELVGHSLHEFAADDGAAWDKAIAIVQSGRVSHFESERQFYRPDGSVVWCLDTVIGLPDESGAISHVLVQLQDITEQKRAAAQLEQAALTDPLTGLPNRTVLEDRLERVLADARAGGTEVGVLFLDLDHFKQVNDTLGHDAGDDLLREVGKRLRTVVRHTDTVVRLGGDEFVVVREQLHGLTQLEDLADRVHHVFAAPFVINGRALTVRVSIGSAVGADLSAEDLLSRADAAMYAAKRNGRSVSSRSDPHPAPQ